MKNWGLWGENKAVDVFRQKSIQYWQEIIIVDLVK